MTRRRKSQKRTDGPRGWRRLTFAQREASYAKWRVRKRAEIEAERRALHTRLYLSVCRDVRCVRARYCRGRCGLADMWDEWGRPVHLDQPYGQ